MRAPRSTLWLATQGWTAVHRYRRPALVTGIDQALPAPRMCGRRQRRGIATHTLPLLARRSPFVVLGISQTATKQEIKVAFRRLALQYHPDVRGIDSTLEEDEEQASDADHMAEIVNAYETLMDQDFSMLLTPGNSKLALACEIFSIQELKDDKRFEVYPIWMRYSDQDVKTTTGTSGTTMDHAVAITIHPDSSVADLKQDLEDLYQQRWNLNGRRKDRYGLSIGWELVVARQLTESTTAEGLTILGNHDFVQHTYNIPSDTLLHAIVQRNATDLS